MPSFRTEHFASSYDLQTLLLYLISGKSKSNLCWQGWRYALVHPLPKGANGCKIRITKPARLSIGFTRPLFSAEVFALMYHDGNTDFISLQLPKSDCDVGLLSLLSPSLHHGLKTKYLAPFSSCGALPLSCSDYD